MFLSSSLIPPILTTKRRIHSSTTRSQSQQYFEYSLATDPTRVYRDLMSYAHKVSEFQLGSLLNISNFESLNPFIYFDLTHQKQDIRDGVTKLTFHYELSGPTAADYNIYAMTLYEQDVELYQAGGKILIRS